MLRRGLGRSGVIRIIVASVILALVLTGCGGGAKPKDEGQADKPKVLRVSLASDVLTFDPHNYRAGTDVMLQNFIYETLVTYDKDMKIVPKLAVSWKQIDPKKWEFKLRDGVQFQDGTPFDANAVKISLERASKAPRGSGFVGFVDKVDVVDKSTVVINLKTQFGPILNNLANPVASIISPDALQKYGDQITRNPVGTGPYKLVQWTPNEKAALEKNPKYWGKAPQIDRLEFKPIPEESTRLMALKSGEVDAIENPAPHEIANLKKDPNFQVIMTPRARNVWLGFNVKDKTLQNKKLREAIAHAVDRSAIVKSVLEDMGREARDGFIPPELVKTDPPIRFDYDVAKAKALMAEAGYANGLELNLWTPNDRYLRDRQVAEVIQQQLKQIGINAKITVMEWGSYLAALGRHEQQLYLIGWGFMTGEPSQAMRQTLFTGNAFNYTNYSDKTFDDLLGKAEQEPDPGKRQAIYQQMQQKILAEDVVAVPLYYMYNTFAVSKKVQGFYLTPIELIDVSEATIN
ncbi:MAG: ABC transporter substrate-binding protein [Actinobacteria bacterium]|nr:ABC transporter substrate-binding protein [Actinomycetota bacterium]